MPLPDADIARLIAAGYELRSELGRGASGVVYSAWQPALERSVAIKRLALAAITETARQRIDREIAVLVQVENPGVVRLMTAIRTGDSVLLVMELVDGPTLRQVLVPSAGRPLDDPDALTVIESLAGTLQHLASLGLVHRDLKPENVFLTGDGRCKLGDFGVALDRLPADPSGRLTRPGSIVGTPQYLSPEQAEGGEATAASDVYGLGVMAYELMTGRLPFDFGGNLLALLAAQSSQAPPDPRQLRPDLPADISAALLWPLEKQPADRPPDPLAYWTRLSAAASANWPDWHDDADLAAVARRATASTATPLKGWPLGTFEENDELTIDVPPFPVVPLSTPQRPLALAAQATGLAASDSPRLGAPPVLVHDGRQRRRSPHLTGARLWLLLALVFLAAVLVAFVVARVA